MSESVYKVLVRGPLPRRPPEQTQRDRAYRLERLREGGMLFEAQWEVRPRTARAIFRIPASGQSHAPGGGPAPHDSIWAVKEALKCWRREMHMLIGAPALDRGLSAENYPFEVSWVSVRRRG